MAFPTGKRLGPYEIQSLLGAGGMGEVYLAQDTRLRRLVALKLLPADSTQNIERLLRFEQEAYAVSALNHPNILTIYEIGKAENVPFIATEFVDGQTLRQQLFGSQMDLVDVLNKTLQIASALSAAHHAGIVHRDIKPENIMVRYDGYVKVLDFGLSKLNESQLIASSSEAETLVAVNTQPGMIIGTIDYLSPEQARGLKVDERSDIWALGVVVYEMVTGKRPFDGATQTDVIASILKTDPLPFSRSDPKVPSELQRIIKKMLCKNPRDRYQTVKDLVVDLKTLLHEIEIAGDADRLIQQPASSVAILPFRNLTNDTEVSFYEFSLADAVITELVRLRALVVRPSSAIAKYLGVAKDPIEAGQELKVGAVLAASFLHAGKRIRVTAQLLDVASGELVWGDRIDSDASDIINVQDIIAQRIVEELHLRLGSDEEVDLAGHATANAIAYEEYLRGRDCERKFISHTLAVEDIEAATEHFNRAVELDPQFALAQCGVGICYMQRNLKGDCRADYVSLAKVFLKKGLALDPKILEARAFLVFCHLLSGEKALAREKIASLRHDAPNNATMHFVSGVLYRLDGDYENAISSFQRMLKLNPSEGVGASWNIARIYMYQGLYDEALSQLDEGALLEPNHPLVRAYRAQVLFYKGNSEEAATLLREVLLDHPEVNAIRPLLAMALSVQGEDDTARALLTDQVRQAALLDWDMPYWL
ncbi:MAG TPA: protein kinase, partial [Pyrinomonadaceae bacterium]